MWTICPTVWMGEDNSFILRRTHTHRPTRLVKSDIPRASSTNSKRFWTRSEVDGQHNTNRDACTRRGGRNRLRVGWAGWVRGAKVDAPTDIQTDRQIDRDRKKLNNGSLFAFVFLDFFSRTTWTPLTARYEETLSQLCRFAPSPAPR